MHDIKDNSIGLLQPSSKDLHDKIFKLSPPLTLGKKEKFWEILQIIAYNEFKLRNNKSWYYGRKNGLTNWNELSEATVGQGWAHQVLSLKGVSAVCKLT